MDPKNEIRAALGELATAADLTLPEVDDAKMGPLGLTKALVKGLPRDALAARLPGFPGTWLDMWARETQEVMVDGKAIIATLFPPAAMLKLEGATEEQAAILRTGATVSIRPPDNDLLVISPVSAEAKVYMLSKAGLTKVADGMAQLVRAEVTKILSSR
jgi:hypothetical protein